MKLRPAVLTAALGASFALVACGDDKEKSSPSATKKEPGNAVALKELAATRAGLDEAAAQVKSGDRDAALETISEAYLTHFEKVEGPLEEVDEELTEELEDGIREELRNKIEDDAPKREVLGYIDDLKAEMATAKAKLEG